MIERWHFQRRTGHEHPHFQGALGNYHSLLKAMGRTEEEVTATVREILERP